MLQEQRLHWEERSFTLQTQTDESLSIADEEPFDLTGGAEDRLALCKPPKVQPSTVLNGGARVMISCARKA